ncbi:MAG: efflux RND transporter periplasmic adaptor subunit [Verrucomicrobiota bacterium]
MKTSLLFRLALATPVAVLVTSCGGPEQPQGPQAMPVAAAQPVVQRFQEKAVFTGRFEATEAVEVRSRVNGYLDKALFEEGKPIEKDAPLFQIDPRPFDAALDSAKARVAQATAARDLAKANLDRAERLVSRDAIAKEEFDIRASELAQAEADLAAARATETSAALDREFCDIKAPISGIAGRYLVTPGNFVSGNTAISGVLTTIVPHDPIYRYFEVDERTVLRFTRMFFKGRAPGREGEPRAVEIATSDSDEFEFAGMLKFSENRLDESTATLQLRAEVQNPDQFLTPGLFARVRIPMAPEEDHLMVRESALGFDQDKRFAWKVGTDNTVSRQYVEVGTLQGGMRAILEGLTEEDRIAVSNIQLLREGAPVQPREVPMIEGEATLTTPSATEEAPDEAAGNETGSDNGAP